MLFCTFFFSRQNTAATHSINQQVGDPIFGMCTSTAMSSSLTLPLFPSALSRSLSLSLGCLLCLSTPMNDPQKKRHVPYDEIVARCYCYTQQWIEWAETESNGIRTISVQLLLVEPQKFRRMPSSERTHCEWICDSCIFILRMHSIKLWV